MNTYNSFMLYGEIHIMKKRSTILLLLFCGILVGAMALGITTLLNLRHPQVQCEAMRPLISFNGINYQSPPQIELTYAPSSGQLDHVVGTGGSGSQNVQYDCGLLSPGEQVYNIKGYQTSFRLAIRTTDGVFFFDVSNNPLARTGADLFDLENKVQSLAVAPIDNPGSETKRISDPATVQKLMGEVLAAPVVSSCPFAGNEKALLFHLKDGGLLELMYWPTGQGLETEWPQCIQLPQDFLNSLS
jgi:hypothetical protein